MGVVISNGDLPSSTEVAGVPIGLADAKAEPLATVLATNVLHRLGEKARTAYIRVDPARQKNRAIVRRILCEKCSTEIQRLPYGLINVLISQGRSETPLMKPSSHHLRLPPTKTACVSLDDETDRR
jgi:hypothetical protein